MAENSKIEWTDHTFNPWIGCTKVSPGCDHCYAETLSKARLGVPWGPGAERRRTKPGNWSKPRAWDRKAAAAGRRFRVFCSSLADVFDNAVPAAWRADLGELIRATPNLDWLLLTKRIGNAAAMLAAMFPDGTPPNVWLGATIVNQAEADRDIPKLLATPAAVRFLSCEPLLGSIKLNALTVPHPVYPGVLAELDALAGELFDQGQASLDRTARLDWIIVGGESGHGARPVHPDWARSLRDQCAAAGVPFLFKQWGEWRLATHLCPKVDQDFVLANDARAFNGAIGAKVGKKAAGRLLDGVQHDGFPAA